MTIFQDNCILNRIFSEVHSLYITIASPLLSLVAVDENLHKSNCPKNIVQDKNPLPLDLFFWTRFNEHSTFQLIFSWKWNIFYFQHMHLAPDPHHFSWNIFRFSISECCTVQSDLIKQCRCTSSNYNKKKFVLPQMMFMDLKNKKNEIVVKPQYLYFSDSIWTCDTHEWLIIGINFFEFLISFAFMLFIGPSLSSSSLLQNWMHYQNSYLNSHSTDSAGIKCKWSHKQNTVFNLI